jgi:hypothetical protein
LIARGTAEPAALALLADVTGLTLPPSRRALVVGGLAPASLANEIARARAAGVTSVLAGIELVRFAGVVRWDDEQIAAALQTLLAGGVAGLVLSWDLWHIPPERLQLVARTLTA